MMAVYYETFDGPITVTRLPDPALTPGGVILRVTASGLCRSDWHGWQGHDPDVTLPHVPGHELAGEIVAVGSKVGRYQVGQRVTLPFVCGCGQCPQCVSGNHQVCDFQFQPGFTHWGSFAEYVAVDYADTNLVALPDSIDDVAAAALGCRFITSYRALVAQGKLRGGQWVAVHGCGGVGLSAILIASALGAQVIGVDIGEEKLTLAMEMGAVATVDGRAVADVPQAIREISGGGVHVSLDALGSQETCFNSIANLRKRGKHIQVGLMTGDHQHPKIPMDRVIAHELEILGSHGMQAFAYEPMLAMIVAGRLRPKKLIGKHISLEEAPAELAAMNSFPGSGITVIDRF